MSADLIAQIEVLKFTVDVYEAERNQAIAERDEAKAAAEKLFNIAAENLALNGRLLTENKKLRADAARIREAGRRLDEHRSLMPAKASFGDLAVTDGSAR